MFEGYNARLNDRTLNVFLSSVLLEYCTHRYVVEDPFPFDEKELINPSTASGLQMLLTSHVVNDVG